MIERAVVAIVLIAAGVLIYRLMIARQKRRTTAIAAADPLLRDRKPGIPAVIYFTTPTCVPCRTQQMPALSRLEQALGNKVQVIRVDATEDPAAADRWGVLTAPTTFVLDGHGRTLAVNHGVADFDKLIGQLQG